MVNKRPRKKDVGAEKAEKAMGASNEKGDAKGSVEEGGKMVRARWSGVTKWEGVGWIAGRNESISKCA